MADPRWLAYARTLIGVREIPGAKHSSVIMGWIKKLGAKALGIAVRDDETPWCGTFCAHVMQEVGILPPPIAVRASAWGLWGRQLIGPRLGCVLVFVRQGGGHVGFYVGEDKTHYHVLGGNQGNAVSITRIAKDRLSAKGMRWPHGEPLPAQKAVHLTPAGVPTTTNEA
jgi:uncharacterized protein (TIGR02594 family)